MSRRMKTLMALLAAVLLLTIGGAAVLAAPPADPVPPQNASKNLFARVAEKLGITTDNLTSAFKQARQELLPQLAKPQTDNRTKPGAVKPQLRNKVKSELRNNKEKPEIKKEIREQAREKIKIAGQDLAERNQKILARVVEILGIPLESLQQAFRQAREEMREQSIQNRLNKAVDKGIITQPESQQTLDWWNSRPKAALAKLFPKGFWWRR